MKKFFRIKLILALLAGLLVAEIGPAAQPAQAADGTCATNGTVTEGDSGNYHWVKFTVTSNSSGDATCTFRTPAGVSIVSVLSVSGGGGGGHDGGGGGGGGGVLFYDQVQLSENTNYSVTVGAGGAAAGTSCVSGNCPKGTNGKTSIFNDNDAAGGGGGGGRYSAGNSLGTGGGAGHTNDATVLSGGTGLGYSDVYTATYGRNAGNNSSTRGGGGGGAVTAGNNGGDADAGVGGKGFTSSIDGTSRVYGGGGGGGTYTGNARSTVNPGGGGLGGNSTNDGANGSDGFGGGGGGGGDGNNPAGRGGSGVVIVRYLTLDTCATPTPVTVGSEVYLKFVTTSESRSCLTNWSVPTGVSSVQLLVVGGGGSGGTRRGTLGGGGGGGAGGFRTESSFNVTAGNSISILVGGGGAAQSASIQQDAWGFDGNLSYFATVIAQGGGGGGAYCGGTDDQTETRSNVVTLSINGRSGGSGGGGGRCTTSTGGAALAASYGNAGGSANATSVSGGGGGKGSAGNSGGAASNPGKGGDGATSTITGSTVTYAGGGGGSGGTAALGGSSIGGTGARENTSAATAGTSQTGSGGGGGYASSGAGGSGVVIVRYQPATCSPSSSTSNGYQYISFTTVTTCNWQIPSGVSSIDLLVVAGGGGGGYDSGGGGGGGGYAEKTGLTVTSGTTFTVAVGGGGAAATSSQSAGTTGTSSSFGTYNATGGTGGGSCTYTGVGWNGVNCNSRNIGGNLGVGSNGSTNSTGAKNGGNGFCFSGNSVTSTCSAAASGLAGFTSSLNSQVYSTGGGGGGSSDATPTANTGSGGKGMYTGNATAGATGVVIVRYSLTLNVTFNSQSGSAVSGATVLSSATLPAPTQPTRSGYDFAGWSLTIGGSAVLFPFTHGKYEDFTLYARWTASVPTLNSVTVAGTALSGSVITATPSATGLGTITYSYQWMRILTGLGTFQIDGATSSTYTLTDSDLLGYVYVNVIASNESGSSSTVYGSMPAEQKIGVVTPTISGYLQSGHLLTGATSSTIPAGAISEYQWLRADTAAGTYTNISGATGSTYRLTSSDVGKYIKFSIVIRNISRGVTSIASTSSATNVVADIYTISYAAGGGSGSGPSTPTTVINGSTFIVPANTFTRAGYTFAGWSNGTSTYQAGETYPAASGNVSLIATWTANSLTITYNSQDGSAISPGSTTTGGSIASSPGTPTRSGYTFKGWFVASSGGSQISFPYTHAQTANFTLYAQWTAVAEAPTIATQPQSASKYSGQSVTFTVNATVTDAGTLSYQWRKNGSNISGATLSTYTINSVASGAAGDYTVVITNTLNGATATATSNAATLTFVATTQLSTPSAPTVSATSGSTTSITVSYSAVTNASSHTVKVYASGVLVGSAQTSFVSGSTITGLTAGTAYTVTVTAIGDGTIYSDSPASSATSVTTNAVAVAPTISSQPTSATKYSGQSVTFSVTSTASDSGSLSYQWKKNGTDISGATTASYSINSVSSGDAGSYTVVVTNTKNGTTATSTSNAAVLTLGTATQLTTPNSPGTTTVTGSTTSIAVTYSAITNAVSHTVKVYAGGVLVGSAYTSFVSGSTITGLTPGTAYTVTVTAIGDGTVYLDSAESGTSSITTNAVAVTPTISTQPVSATKYAGQAIDFTVGATASDSGSLSYQWKKNGTDISGAQSSTLSINPVSSSDAGDYTVVVTNSKNGTTTSRISNIATLTFAIAVQLSKPSAPTASATSGSTTSITVSFTSVANASSHTVKVYASGVLVGTPYTLFSSGSAITNLSTNTAYTVTVTGIGDGTRYSDSAESNPTSVTTNPEAVKPTISSQPTSTSKYTGQSVTFSVTASASDSGSLSYQWKVGGISISGATSATYTINTLSLGNAGQYTVVVTNSKNGTTSNQDSNIATLSVSVQTYTVTYSAPDKSSGSVPVDSVGPYVANATVTLLGNTGGLTRGSYSFVGWRTASDPTVRSANSNYVITSDITFIAVWTEIYQLSFDANGGSGTMADLDGPTVTIPSSTFTRSGYTFSGWNSAANGSGFSLTVGQSAPLTQDVKIYAQWTQDVVTTNTITFTAITNKSYGDNFLVKVSASSGLTVTVSSSTTSVCTVSTLSVTAISVGTCTLVASQAGNGTYPAATSITRSFSVGKKSLVISIDNLAAVVGGAVSDPSYSQSGLVTSLGDAITTPTYKYQGIGGTFYAISTTKPNKLGSYRISIDSIALTSGLISNYQANIIAGELTIAGEATKTVGAISVKQASGDKATELLSNFSDSTTSYQIYVGADVSAVIATITRPSGSLINAQVKVNNSGWRKLTFLSNVSNSGVLPLPENVNNVYISTIASDLSVKEFTITIYRDTKSAPTGGNAASPAPTVSPTPAAQVVSIVRFYVNNPAGNSSGLLVAPITPSFTPSTNSYNVSFTNTQSATIMKADFTGAGNTLRLKINSGAFSVIPSTGSSSTIALSVGDNVAILRVSSTASATPVDYTFTLTRAAPSSALVPTFGTATASSTGFTVQISNYSSDYIWSATATAGGAVAISNTGLITVSGLSPATASTVTVTSLRAGYANGRATLTQTTSSG